jgi:hypothetical protein
MASDQNEKYTDGVSMVKNLEKGNHSPLPYTTRETTFLHG